MAVLSPSSPPDRGRRPAVRRQGTALCLATLLAACAGDPPPAPDVVVRFDGREIRYSRFERYLARSVGEPAGALPSDVLSQLFDQFLDEELLARYAAERGLAAEESDRRQAVEALLAASTRAVTEAEVAAYYREHRADFLRPERVRIAQILLEERGAAEAAARELAAGADFAAVARRFATDPGAPVAGGRTELSRDDLPPAFADLLFGLEAGEVSAIIPADYGFHIFKVEEHLPAEELSLAAVAGEVRSQLRRRLAEERLAELVAEAHDLYNPRVYERNLPFNYQGRHAEAPPA